MSMLAIGIIYVGLTKLMPPDNYSNNDQIYNISKTLVLASIDTPGAKMATIEKHVFSRSSDGKLQKIAKIITGNSIPDLNCSFIDYGNGVWHVSSYFDYQDELNIANRHKFTCILTDNGKQWAISNFHEYF